MNTIILLPATQTPKSITPVSFKFVYKDISNGKFVLNQVITLQNPGGFTDTDTLTQISANTIMIHSVYDTHVLNYSAQTDTYYQK